MPINPKCWVKCLRCEHREMIRRSWLERAAGVRCARCGGPVEASQDARKALTKGMDRKKEDDLKNERNGG